jgi:hypothetical protein
VVLFRAKVQIALTGTKTMGDVNRVARE